MNMNFAKNRLSKSSKNNNCYNHEEINLLETQQQQQQQQQQLQTRSHSATKANQASVPEDIDFDTETEVNNYCDSPLEKKKQNIKFTLNKASFKNDLKKSDHSFEKFLCKNSFDNGNIKKSKLSMPSQYKNDMAPIEIIDDEEPSMTSHPIKVKLLDNKCVGFKLKR